MVGIGCRFPGDADTPQRFWDLLREGRDTTTDVPAQRWQSYADAGPRQAAALAATVRRGSFLGDIAGFDADFFGISPREAELMDPQQRILLEVAWEALEHAGIPPRSLAGSETGVFVGSCTDDYRRHLLEDIANMDAWSGIGAARCAVANRVSHALDLRGPSLAVDTACSASLVALHLACQSLRLGESTLALAGGVNILVSPGETVTLDLAGALAADGRSKAFDATADGYGRGEGCGVVVLKLLADAERDGDRVLAVVRGSAVSQDGHTPGIMAPNGAAQEHVMVRACRAAGIEPHTVGFVEAHGTGTLLGDPLEAAALSAVYGAGRDSACPVGSVKANIGHLEGAAGIASVVKAVLALGHARIPASPLATGPNPAIPWQDNGLRIAAEELPWPDTGGPRRACVSGFGYGGTIAHVVLEQAPDRAPATVGGTGRPRVFPLSAASEEALRLHAGRLADRLGEPDAALTPASVGHTLACRRSHLPHRAAVVAADLAGLAAGLYAVAADEPADTVATATAAPAGAGLVWVFSGHGSQWAGMGRELIGSNPVFASVIDELAPVFAEEIGFTPREVLLGGDLGDGADVARVQTMIFAVQVGLAALWKAHGVVPDAVIGHSVGEIAAAVTAGALDLESGARLICRRSRLLERVAGNGAMAMVGLPFDEVTRRLAGTEGVEAAIVSSPVSTVVSGDPAAVGEVVAGWQAEGITVRRVASDVAFHSPQMDPLTAELAAVADLPAAAPVLPVYTTALDDPRAEVKFDGAYWAANLRNPVRLAPAVLAAAQDGYRAFLEISAHPVVTHSIGETLAHHGIDAFVGSTLRRDRPEHETMLAALGEAHCAGVPVDWSRLFPATGPADLPVNPWRHRRLWWTPESGGGPRPHDPASHTLLGAVTPVAGSGLRLWQTTLDDSSRPYPGSHTINGVEIVPAAVFLTSFFDAAAPDGPAPVLRDVALRRPLMTAEPREVQVVADGDAVRLASRAPDGQWITHADAVVDGPGPAVLDRAGAAPAGLPAVPPTLVGDRLSAVGVPSTGFDWTVAELGRGEGALRGQVTFDPGGRPSWAPLLDAVLTLAPVTYPGDPVLRMVVAADRIAVTGEPPKSATVDITVCAGRPDAVDVTVTGPSGDVAATVTGLVYAVIGDQALDADPRRLVHELVWRPVELTPGEDRELVVVGEDVELAQRLAGDRPVTAASAFDPATLTGPADVVLVLAPAAPESAAAYTGLLARTVRRYAGHDTVRLWCVTTNGVVTGADGEQPVAPAAAAIAGLGRVAATSHPGLWGGIVDVEPDTPAEAVRSVVRAAPGEPVVALRGGRALVGRLRRADREPASEAPRCRPDGTYLVTGGPTSLGLRVARRLAEAGARRILFTTAERFPARSKWESTTDEHMLAQIDNVRGLEAAGIAVRVVNLDITDPSQAALLSDTDRYGLPPIRGVVCVTAAAEEPGLAEVDDTDLRVALRTRALGPWLVHERFGTADLDFLVLVSSGEQVAGVSERAGDGSAAAFVDAIVAHRAAGDGLTLVLGLVPGVTEDDVIAAWDHAAARGSGAYTVLRPSGLDTTTPVLSELSETDSEPAAAEPAVLDRAGLVEEVRAQIAREMKLSPADLDPERSLAEQGLDSILTIMVRRRLDKRFDTTLPPTLLWQSPTVSAIADHLLPLLER
ncbi:acyltransferase domain-containing protein [Amycolatopsis suaedae]|uniref:Acyltransferase domain-containing protein n=1 Tax=Amycolatopsis suaedae TaxID=2510978 RepID=A0A4V2ELH0_9PSEU|nr:acyltransferase domain-containing protein [Amycolatopsis suaedae]